MGYSKPARPLGKTAHISLLASGLTASPLKNASTSLEPAQRDNLVLIKICCYEQGRHNDGLRFQSENLYGTTAGELKPPVSHGNLLALDWSCQQNFPAVNRKIVSSVHR